MEHRNSGNDQEYHVRQRSKNGRRFKQFHPRHQARRGLRFESLESRQLLAGDLVAHWRAESLNANVADGAAVSTWSDSVQGIPAGGEGSPLLVRGELGGRSVIRFDSSDGVDSFRVDQRVSPMRGANDFSIAVSFVTSSEQLQGNQGPWFENTGLVDANSLGFSTDWGISLNESGQIGAGMGTGFVEAPRTLYSTSSGLNDGQLHTVVFTRSGSRMSLYVDDSPPDVRADGSTAPRSSEIDMRFGMLQSGTLPLDGDIAEVRFYNGALDPSEVSAVFADVDSFYNSQPPTAADDEYTTTEDSPLFFVAAVNGVLANDSGVEQDTLTAVLVEDVQHGTLSLNADGSFFYDSNAEFFGSDSFAYTANDIQASDVARVTINVLPQYDPVRVEADEYKLRPTEQLNVDTASGVLANDANPDSASLNVELVDHVAAGQLVLRPDGSFNFDPQGFAGTTSFTYRVNDGTGLSAEAMVTLVVNTEPVARDDSFVVTEDTLLILDPARGVLSNDSDADDDALTATLVSMPAHGSLQFFEDGSFSFAPNADYFGPDLFSYQTTDGVDASETVLVRLDVTPVNDAPTAVDDVFFALPNQLLEVAAANGVLANDTDIDSPSLSAVPVAGPDHGILVLNPDGSLAYTANAGFVGADSFKYRASDFVDQSSETTVTIVVNTIESLQQVVINEVHYDPDLSFEAVEFIELHNRASFPVDLSGWSIRDGVDFTFPPEATIGANGYVVVAQDPTVLESKFGVMAMGPWQGRLNNDGETIELRTASSALIDIVTYKLGFPWPTVGDAPGHSMQLIKSDLDNDLGGSWRPADPTPSATNSVLLDNPPPHLRQVDHQPRSPEVDQPVTITVKVTDDDGVANVELEYQVVEPGSYIRLTDAEYEANWTTVAMRDDGTQGDAQAADSVYSVVLPAALQTHRRLIRYRITATDMEKNSIRGPYEDDPAPNFAYFVYDGIPEWTGADRPGTTDAVTYGADVMNSLPAYHLIAVESDVINSQYVSRFNDRRFKGTLVYDGVVYDHMEFKNRGQNSTYVTGKNKWKLFFHRGHEFRIRDDYGNQWSNAVRKLNLGTAASPWARPNRGLAGMDEALAFKFFNLAGVPAPKISAFQLRIIDDAVEASPSSQFEGDLWGLYLAFEDPGGRFLNEHGLPDGNLFRMQGGTGELRHQGLGLPGNRSDLRDFTSSRTGYNKRNPIQPIEWWRDNVDLDRYYSYRAVIEAVNHSDLRDQENSLQYFNSETGKWSQLPWDLDLLYEEFDRWGPDGVQNQSRLEQVRLALEHEELNIEFQARLREMQDLLFNADQAWQAVEEYARYVEPFAAIDRAMWDYHPRTTPSRKGYFYRSPAPYDGGAAGLVRRELTSPDFEGMVNWVKEFIVDGGFGGDQLRLLHEDPDLPEMPTISTLAEPDFPITDLRFQVSAFRDPQGDDTFHALQWRVGEVTDRNAPAYDPSQPVHFEVTPVWESGTLDVFNNSVLVDANALQVGHAYRARVRMQDNTGRWSHWSAPVQFVPTLGSSEIAASLRISEVHYHPADPTADEIAAGFTNSDDFEFIELENIGDRPIDLGGAQLATAIIDGAENGVAFAFSDGAITQLQPGQRVLVVEDQQAFRLRYGADLPVAGQWNGRLNNAGETITLSAFGEPFLQFRYEDDWYPATDGAGPSLQIIDVNSTDLSSWSRSQSWRPSRTIGGTPGRSASQPGDSNHDGVFDSTDLVLVFKSGEYEDELLGNSTWEEGDWNGDGEFSTADLVLAFQLGDYVAAAVLSDLHRARSENSQPA